MSQLDFERDFDAAALNAFGDQLSSPASYQPPGGGDAVACRVLVDHDLGTLGNLTPVSDTTKIITLFKADVPAPLGKGRITVDGLTFVLDSLFEDDFSRSVWVCRRAS